MWKKEDDWFWEGNVQEKLAKYFENQGYKVKTTDTLSKSRGVDISAFRNSDEMLVEVKGYPSNKYMDGSKRGQIKRTQPTLQAKHWFSDALLSVIRRKGKFPNSSIAIGLPEFTRYLDLIKDANWALEKLGVRVFIVTQNGEVYEKRKSSPLQAESAAQNSQTDSPKFSLPKI